jgi:hypothetical protein
VYVPDDNALLILAPPCSLLRLLGYFLTSIILHASPVRTKNAPNKYARLVPMLCRSVLTAFLRVRVADDAADDDRVG